MKMKNSKIKILVGILSIFLVFTLVIFIKLNKSNEPIKQGIVSTVSNRLGDGNSKTESNNPKMQTGSKFSEATSQTISEKPQQKFSGQNSKADSFYIEDVVRNFSNIYPFIVNNSETDYKMITSIVNSNSKLYIDLKKEFESYRNSKANIEYTSFKIQDMKADGSNKYDVKVKQTIKIKIGSSITEKTEEVEYVVSRSKTKASIIEIIKS